MPDINPHLPSKAQLLERARALLTHPNMRDMGHSEYDAAWVARVPKLELTGLKVLPESAFPEVLQVVRETQSADGGWAPEVKYVSARLLATLSSILAVTEFTPSDADRQRAERGAQFVTAHWPKLAEEPDLTIGFELVALALIDEASERGDTLQLPHMVKLAELKKHAHDLHEQKMGPLRKHPHWPAVIYHPQFSLGFSLEFLRDKLNLEHTVKLQATGTTRQGKQRSGLISASVATTAHFIRRSDSTHHQPGQEAISRANLLAREGLRALVTEHGPNNIPFGTGTGMWQRLWIAYHLHIAGLSADLQRELDHYSQRLRPHLEEKKGLGWSMDVAYCDSDDTSVALGLTHDLRQRFHPEGEMYPDSDWALLQPFERPDGFVGFLFERGASVSANAHVLGAIQGRRYKEAPAWADKAARLLLAQRRQDGFWTDKWHASAYYVTSRATRALLRWTPAGEEDRRERARAVLAAVQWLHQVQRQQDGGWGWFEHSSPEETAYALHALAEARLFEVQSQRANSPQAEFRVPELRVDLDILARGAAYLSKYEGAEPNEAHPKLWIAKDLYRPIHVVRSAVIGAQALCARALDLDGTSAESVRVAAAR